MAWRDHLRPASFRGVAFEVNSSQFEGGRRGENHEYPLRDESYFEDLGRKARRFTITGFVVGADYMTGRDALIEALEAEGPGQLVHPFYGSRNVSVPDFRVSESDREGGVARFTITFEETGESTQPAAGDDRAAQVKSAADIFDIAAIESFAERFMSAGFPDFTIAGALDILDLVAAELLAGTNVPAFADDVSGFLSTSRTAVADASSFASRVVALISAFGFLGSSGSGGASRIARGAVNPNPSIMPTLDRLISVSDDDYISDVPRETAARQQEAINTAAMAGLVRRAAFSAKARRLADTEFVSANEANAAMVEFADSIDAEVERSNVSDAEYTAARALTAKVVADLSARLGGLPQVRKVRVPQVTPAVVLAHALYDTPFRDEEIIARNDVVRPGFLPSGEPIEVLSE